MTEAVLNAVNEALELNKPGKGIAFVLDVEKTIRINHSYIKTEEQAES